MSAPAMRTVPVIDAFLGMLAALSPVRELKGNRGYFVDAINAWAGSPLSSAWCLNLLHYAGAHAIGKAIWPLPINGNCDVLLAFARRRGVVFDTPERGAIGLKLDPTNPDNATHAFAVDAVLPNGRFATREGNSNEDGGREGIEVVEITRPRSPGERYVFVYWWLLFS